ncbi:MAG: hypothetical protein ACRD4O_20450 [Bryobacteraceae bacterium]
MELIAINLARLAAFVEVDALDPKGQSNLPDNINALIRRYGFSKYPTTIEEMDLQKGIQFAEGSLGDIAITSIQLFHNGLIIDTRSSTDNSKRVFDDLVILAKEMNGASVVSRRYHLTSQFIFRSELKLALLNPLLQPIADRLARSVSGNLNHSISFEPTAVLIGPQAWALKIVPSSFSIERRSETPFNENTYFSSAPLPTDEHLKLIEEFEQALSAK